MLNRDTDVRKGAKFRKKILYKSAVMFDPDTDIR